MKNSKRGAFRGDDRVFKEAAFVWEETRPGLVCGV